MFSTKFQVQNDRTNRKKISCVCQNLQFRMYFAIKTSMFELLPLLRFLCLINSFTGGMFPVCTTDPIDPIDPLDPIDSIDPIYRNSSSWKIIISQGISICCRSLVFLIRKTGGGAQFFTAFNDYCCMVVLLFV